MLNDGIDRFMRSRLTAAELAETTGVSENTILRTAVELREIQSDGKKGLA